MIEIGNKNASQNTVGQFKDWKIKVVDNRQYLCIRFGLATWKRTCPIDKHCSDGQSSK